MSTFAVQESRADDFSFSFEWGDLKLCTTGKPNRVSNPVFTLANVPAGAHTIKFRMKDVDVPNYNHGGGKASYSGTNIIESGAFKYKSPCPPNGTHTYQWKARILDADGNKLTTATAERDYPE